MIPIAIYLVTSSFTVFCIFIFNYLCLCMCIQAHVIVCLYVSIRMCLYTQRGQRHQMPQVLEYRVL